MAAPVAPHASDLASRSEILKVAAASLIGTSIEWYDFFLYGTAAALVFNKLFFPTFAPLAGTMAAFATYAVGFVARPVGGIVFGHYGDKLGRKTMLYLTLLIMGLAGAVPPELHSPRRRPVDPPPGGGVAGVREAEAPQRRGGYARDRGVPPAHQAHAARHGRATRRKRSVLHLHDVLVDLCRDPAQAGPKRRPERPARGLGVQPGHRTGVGRPLGSPRPAGRVPPGCGGRRPPRGSVLLAAPNRTAGND